ncbi:MAG: hypothetical protein ACRDT6_01140 [Micromonosporaceae bacterium]
MDDAPERTWELLHTLSKAEERSPGEIAEDISSPEMDTAYVRTFPADLPSGYISLNAGLRVIQGVRGMLEAAGRVEVEGVRPAFSGTRPPGVVRVLDEVTLGPSKSGSYILPLRVSVQRPDQSEIFDAETLPLARRMLLRLLSALTAAHAATMSVRADNDYSAFDETVDAGVSANLCRSLSDLAGLERREPFEVGFRWGRALPSPLAAATITFPEGAGSLVFEVAKQLERLAAGGEASIRGVIEGLHDEPYGNDRWRIRVRGELIAEAGGIDPRRPVWVRLGRLDYERAIEAHRERRTVRAQGSLELRQRRVELTTHAGGFEILS